MLKKSMTNKVRVTCECGLEKFITQRCFNDSVKKYGRYTCLRCIIIARGSKNGDGMKNKVRKLVGILNNDKIIVDCMKCKSKTSIKYSTLKAWKKRHSGGYICGACLNREQDRSKSRSDEHRKNCSIRSKRYWKNPEYRDKLLKHLAEVRSLGPGPSNLERSVWKCLDDLGVVFKSARDGKSFTLGYWSFDVMIDKSQLKNSDRHLLIEVDGFYRHNRKDVVHYDKAKETFVRRYHRDYNLVRILEHEFLAPGKLKDRLRQLINNDEIIPNAVVLNDLNVDVIDFSEAVPFLGAYHYLGFVNKRGVAVGCSLNSDLIGVALYAGLTRSESASRLGMIYKDCRELIRFCISPYYSNKNLGSWFLSKSIKKLLTLAPNIKVIVTFADSTIGHTGALYKAANFDFDGKCGDSYCWIDSSGYVMHKKTMWDHARKNGISEVEMASKSGYMKVKNKPKHRFLYWLDKKSKLLYTSQDKVMR